MFQKNRPVPSKAALRALYQLAYISSGTAVGVAGDVDHVVLVATLGLSDDVVGGDVLGISGELCGDIASGSEQGHEALTRGLGDAAGWHIFVVCFRVALERVAEEPVDNSPV